MVKRNKTKKNANLFRYLSELKVTIAVGRSRIFGIYIKLMSLSSFKRNCHSYNTGNEESKFLLPRQLIENVNHPSMTSSVYPFVKAIKVDNYTCVAGTKKKTSKHNMTRYNHSYMTNGASYYLTIFLSFRFSFAFFFFGAFSFLSLFLCLFFVPC